MKKIMPFIVIAALALSTLACSITVDVPTVTTGPTQTLGIDEALPSESEAVIKLDFGAGELNLSSGSTKLVEGSIQYNVPDWEPTITREANRLQIRQRNLENVRLPDEDVVNEWNLKLGSLPIDLTINAGAYKGTLDLGGLALTRVSIADGASQSTVDFSQPNLVDMESFSYKTAASEVKIYNIANANTDTFSFESGAGSYTLDFNGELLQDIQVSIKSGVSNIEIIIPEGVPARVTVGGGLNNISPRGTWTISNNVYEKEGSGPEIFITLDMGLGNLELISR